MPSDLSTTSPQIRYDLKAGRAWVAVFEASTGTAVLEYRTPRGSLRAERPRLVLWRPGAPAHILADLDLATTERSILDRTLGSLLARGPELAGEEQPLYDLLLRLVRNHHLGLDHRPRAVRVGDAVASIGASSLGAWASCLALGDLQAAILAALEPEEARAA